MYAVEPLVEPECDVPSPGNERVVRFKVICVDLMGGQSSEDETDDDEVHEPTSIDADTLPEHILAAAPDSFFLRCGHKAEDPACHHDAPEVTASAVFNDH
eukprot:7898-Eustigmatos_ZCMA.PRE.1